MLRDKDATAVHVFLQGTSLQLLEAMLKDHSRDDIALGFARSMEVPAAPELCLERLRVLLDPIDSVGSQCPG